MSAMHLFTSKTLANACQVAAITSALVLGLCSSAASAAEAEDSQWGLGVGAASSLQPYKGVDRDTQGLPLIYFENEYVRVFGPTAAIKLPGVDISDSQQLDFSIVGEYDFSGYDDDDARILEGMSDRKGGFWGAPR